MTTSSNSRRENIIDSWTVNDIIEWGKTVGFSEIELDILRKEKIAGSCIRPLSVSHFQGIGLRISSATKITRLYNAEERSIRGKISNGKAHEFIFPKVTTK